MIRVRRSTDSGARLEMTPMIDVVFLLLTFFIFSLIVMIRAEVLPVRLTALEAGGKGPLTGEVEAITIDRHGELYWNRRPLPAADLDRRLAEFAQRSGRPHLFLALEAQSDSDRGPVLLRLIERVHAAGIDDFVIVGARKPE